MRFSAIALGLATNALSGYSGETTNALSGYETMSMLQSHSLDKVHTNSTSTHFAGDLNRLLAGKDIYKLVRAVRKAIKIPQDIHPQDDGTYGPFMVRLAWHCSGTFRATDNKGGCAGGRIRYAPELNWADNGNLDKAIDLLRGVKGKFKGLSWGDLFVLAGTLAIYDMGGPTKTMCFGRIDDPPEVGTPISQALNCDPDWAENNQAQLCDRSEDIPGQLLGGLIYVNPEGPGDPPNPNPYLSAQDVERTFGRMGMTPQQTVALIGGGHAFGRAHAGSAGSNGIKTSMFDGQWTMNPSQWDNSYFTGLIGENWEVVTTDDVTGLTGLESSPKTQWRTVDRDSPIKDTIMLTADVALKAHTLYSKYATLFAEDPSALDLAFADAWYTLTTNGPGWLPTKKCIRLDDFDPEKMPTVEDVKPVRPGKEDKKDKKGKKGDKD